MAVLLTGQQYEFKSLMDFIFQCSDEKFDADIRKAFLRWKEQILDFLLKNGYISEEAYQEALKDQTGRKIVENEIYDYILDVIIGNDIDEIRSILSTVKDRAYMVIYDDIDFGKIKVYEISKLEYISRIKVNDIIKIGWLLKIGTKL